jgi:myosin heavy subunit
MRHVPPSRKLVFSFVLVLAGVLVAPSAPRAADQKAALAKIKARYQAAAAAYDDGELEKVETQLQQALKLAEDNGLAENKIVAQTYVLYGVLEVAGLKNTAQGVKYFAKAIEISPAIQVPPTMASKAVLAAFERAENQESEPATAQAGAGDDSEEVKPSKPSGRPAKGKQGSARDAESEKPVDDLAAAKVSESLQQAETQRQQKERQEQEKELASAKGHAQELAKEKAEQERQIADAKSKLHELEAAKQNRDTQIADLKAQLAQVTKEKQAVDKQLAASQASEKKERESSSKLAHDKSESDSQLGDSKRNLQDLAKQKADLERQLAAALADARKEREAKEKLAAAKADADRQLTDEKRNLQDLGKQKADLERQLAAALADAKKEREAKEKLAAARKEADARENERKTKESEERAKLEKLAEGPDLPAHVTEPIACTIPDEIPPGADLYVHCVPRPGVDAKVVALYYRAGGVLYNVSTMDRSKKGWYTALIPGGKIAGKVLHYYVEARNGRSDVVGSNGRANSPNIATIRAVKR